MINVAIVHSFPLLETLGNARLCQQLHHHSKLVVFNLLAGTEPQRNSPLARGTPGHISAQESKQLLSIVAFVKLLAEALDCAGGALGFRGSLVDNYCSRHYRNEYSPSRRTHNWAFISPQMTIYRLLFYDSCLMLVACLPINQFIRL